MGRGQRQFAHDPPNATISVLGADGASVEDAVVVLKAPKLDGNKLTFEVSVLEGGLSKATGPASLFIDWFAARGGFGRVGDVGFGRARDVGFGHVGYVGGVGYHGALWHGAWYAHPAAVAAGAAVGAAAVGAAAGAYYHPYYPPACGYYPYPPCY